ncbi:hypothetical protein HID58_055335 [Brassica napus]|uniref:Uncharacterized protein n=1 Tax=Brassica napus TaxID=3708 RepID=A0ABQ8AK91_BRANA|nr:hypothetical protein HID58_055335 [Brassica napus]
MGYEELKPIANTRTPDGDFEGPEIAEQLGRSQNSYGDHGTVASITGAAHYKKRSTHKEGTR